MKKLFSVCVLTAVLFSCSKEQSNDDIPSALSDEVQFKGVTFSDWQEAYDTYEFLSTLETEDELLSWTMDKGHASLFAHIITSTDEHEIEKSSALTPELMAIMNKDYHFMVGDKLVSFSNNTFYESSKGSPELVALDNISLGQESYKTIRATDESTLTAAGGSFSLNENGNSPGSGHDFYRESMRPCPSGGLNTNRSARKLRYVQKFTSVKFGGTVSLYVETKLYWRNSRNQLRYTSMEYRNYGYSLSGTVSIRGGSNEYAYRNINMNTTSSCVRTNIYKKLVAQINIANFGQMGVWNINLSGNVSHHINGDWTTNKWYATPN